MTCTDPRFRYMAGIGWWSACTSCGGLAWSHPQADPLADIRNTIEAARTGDSPANYPPVMRPLPDNVGHGVDQVQ